MYNTVTTVAILLVCGCHCFMNEGLSASHDWNVDSIQEAFDIKFYPSLSSSFEMKHIMFATKSYIESITLGDIENKPKSIYRVNAPSDIYQIIFENGRMFVTQHLDTMGNSNFILWDTQSGNRLNKVVINKPLITYACAFVAEENSVRLFFLSKDMLLEGVNLSNDVTIFTHQLSQELINKNLEPNKSFVLQASVVNFQPKLYLYYVHNANILVADVSLVTGQPSSIAPYSVVFSHDSQIDLSKCYKSIHGLVCFFQSVSEILAKTYVFTINRDNFQQQFLIGVTVILTPKFHSNCILELHDQNNILKYLFYADGIIANISNQIPTKKDTVVLQSIGLLAQNIHLGFASLNDGNLNVYELQFEENRIVFHPIHETKLNFTRSHFYNNLQQMKFILNMNNNVYDLYLICQFFDNDHNQLLQLHYNDVLHWTSESTFAGITNLLPIEIMAQRKLNDDEILAYQSEFYINRLFYRLKINSDAIFKFFLHFGNHFGLTREFNVYKNYRHSNIVLVTTKYGYVYGVYSKNGMIIWTHKLPNIIPFVDSHSKYSLPVYLLRKSYVKNGIYYPAIAVVVGQRLVNDQCHTLVWAFDPLTGKSIDVTNSMDFFDTNNFESVIDQNNKGVYKILKSFNCLIKPHHIFSFPISPLMNSIILASIDYDRVIAFPSISLFNQKINLPIIETVYQLKDLSVNGATLYTDKNQIFVKNNRWRINLPRNATNVEIHSADLDYYKDKTKMIFDNKPYRPFDLINVAAVSYMLGPSFQQNTYSNNFWSLYILFVDVNSGKVIKSFFKHNILKSIPVVINLNGNLCTVISTNYRTKMSSVTTIGFFYDSESFDNDTNRNLDNNLLLLKETYFLGTFQIGRGVVTKTYFGFSHKSLILSRNDGRLWAISYKLLDPRRNMKSRIFDSSSILDYYPQIEPIPINFVNKEYILYNTTRIVTFPSHLESTSVVCAASNTGLYCSHLAGLNGAPFDILGVNFDRYFVAIFIIVLIIVLFVSKRFSERKLFYNQWL